MKRSDQLLGHQMLLEKLIPISAMLSIAPHLPGSFFVVGYYQEVWGKGCDQMSMIIFFFNAEELEFVSESQLSRAAHSCESEGGNKGTMWIPFWMTIIWEGPGQGKYTHDAQLPLSPHEPTHATAPSWRGLCLAVAHESTAGCDGMCGGGLGIQGNF